MIRKAVSISVLQISKGWFSIAHNLYVTTR